MAEGAAMTAMVLSSLMDTAQGREDPDVIIRGGRVVNVFSGEIKEADVWIKHGRIACLKDEVNRSRSTGPMMIDAEGAFVSPGLIDSHYHMGGSHLDPSELARALLARGTTALATDFYEVYCVGGPDGVRFAMGEATRQGMKIIFLEPASLIGLEEVGTFGWDVKASDMLEMLKWPETVGIMEPPASLVLARHPDVLEIVAETIRLGKIFAGHAPGEVNDALHAYVATSASSEHESRQADEALAKLRVGMRPMMRESSASPDLANLIELARTHPASSRYMMLCSDETDPGDLVRKGHMDLKVRMAIEGGIDPVTAIQMATINAAEYFRVTDQMGSVAPGRYADLVLVEKLEDFRAAAVFASGRLVGRDGESLEESKPTPPPESLVSRINVPRPFQPTDFVIQAPGVLEGDMTVRVIGVRDGTLVSQALERTVPISQGMISLDQNGDVLKIALAERHHASGRIGKGLVEGFGFQSGAVALTYCHVYHNLLIIGTTEEQMAVAANAVAELGGGVAVVFDGDIVARWKLPMIGVLDERPLADVQKSFDEMNDQLRKIGCALQSPILSLSFIALPTIPAYGLTDRGLFDVATQQFVDVFVR